MSVKLHEAFCMDSFMDRLLWFDDFHGDQVKDEWDEVMVGAGSSIAVIDQQMGGIVRLTAGPAINRQAYIDWNDIRSLLVSKKVSIEFRTKLAQTNALHVVLSLRFDIDNRIKFRYDTAIGGNWQIETTNGGASTLQDSGIAANTSYHIFRIECFPTDEIHFYIDGVETALSPITTNIPPDYLQPRAILLAKENVAKSMDIDYVYIRQER